MKFCKHLLVALCAMLLPASAFAGPITLAQLDRLKAETSRRPSDPDPHFDLAMAYARTVYLEAMYLEFVKIHGLDKDYAQKVFKREQERLRKSPRDIEALFRLSFAHYFLNRREDAIRTLEQILRIDPAYVWAYNYLAFLTWQVKNDLPKALIYAQKAIELEPTNAVAYFLLGHGYYKAGRLKEAADAIALSMKLRVSHPT